jgi:hypothetical protein
MSDDCGANSVIPAPKAQFESTPDPSEASGPKETR